jgi:hypothetical protein
MTGQQVQVARLWARVVALVVDWTAALALALRAALAGSALGGPVEQVWAPLREGAYLVGGIGTGRSRAGRLPGPRTSAGGSRHGRTLGRELDVKLPPSAVTGPVAGRLSCGDRRWLEGTTRRAAEDGLAWCGTTHE